ncbi:hypothetical protein RRG08_019683 [Elysia crispata]|uniref:Ig-like domain-containing protein n=1 Tax=Elysia crispata TaxID=231223 RepID=A0AAE0YW74_9GAST|nr:hypothetical protein RRG08_019683 [Elysia crispata]
MFTCALMLFLQGLPVSFGDPWDPSAISPEELLPPTFRDTPDTVLVQEGKTAKLRCSIDNLGTKKVTWRRVTETNPLTIERNRFVQDRRIKLEHEPLQPEWNLIIEQATDLDQGRYVCEISTTPTLKNFVFLKVDRGFLINQDKDKAGGQRGNQGELKPAFTISNNTVVDKNKPLVLTCSAASDKSAMPDEIDWFFEGQILATDPSRGLSIKKNVEIMNRSISSILRIESAQMSDAGSYICRTSASQMGKVIVDVLNADSKNSKRGTEKNSKDDRYDIARSRHDRFDRDELQDKEAGNGACGLVLPSASLGLVTSAACLMSLLINCFKLVGANCLST